MDGLDRKIVSLLREDGRASYTDIADDVGVSEGTVRNRVQRLQDDGVIKRFTVDVDASEQITVIVMAAVDPAKDIHEILDRFPSDVELAEVTGDWDIIARFSRPDSTVLNETLEEIRKIDGVTHTKTYTVLASHRR